MEVQAMQEEVAKFVKEYDLAIPIRDRLLDLVSEVGELSKEVLLNTDYGKTAFQPDECWERELGDVLFALLCLANATEVDLSGALRVVLEKYRIRREESGEIGSGFAGY